MYHEQNDWCYSQWQFRRACSDITAQDSRSLVPQLTQKVEHFCWTKTKKKHSLLVVVVNVNEAESPSKENDHQTGSIAVRIVKTDENNEKIKIFVMM